MCQFCAKGMAEKGWDWPSMMKVFYPGAGVTKAY
jgi:peptidoglycan hydrolase-like amidase